MVVEECSIESLSAARCDISAGNLEFLPSQRALAGFPLKL